MKFLVLLAVLAVAYLLWRNARLRERGTGRPAAPPPPTIPQDMVACPVCSVHLPRGDAMAGPDGRYYCSREHLLLGTGAGGR